MQQHKTIPGGSREDTLTDLKLEVGDASPGSPAANFWSLRRSPLENGQHGQSQREAMGKTPSEGTAWAGSTARDFTYVIHKPPLWLKLIWIRFSVTWSPNCWLVDMILGRKLTRSIHHSLHLSSQGSCLCDCYFFLEKYSWIISFFILLCEDP